MYVAHPTPPMVGYTEGRFYSGGRQRGVGGRISRRSSFFDTWHSLHSKTGQTRIQLVITPYTRSSLLALGSWLYTESTE